MNRSIRTPRPFLPRCSRGLLVALSCGAILAGTAKADWALLQNTPNPFCDRGSSPQSTIIGIELDQACTVILTVLSPDSTADLRTLVDGDMAPGMHQVIWDGHDEQGNPLPDGSYPYHLIARGGEVPTVYFEDTKIATISCVTPVDRGSWGRTKKHYR